MTSRASGRVARRRANAVISAGSRRRLKIEPTNSTSGSRGARGRGDGAARHARRNDADRDRRDTDSRSTISPRENSESVKIDVGGARRLPRQQPAPRALRAAGTIRGAPRTTRRGSSTASGTPSASGAV